MKIKKVEIQAFRAYDEAKDCTFDFSTSDNKFADFVSIYAPNGFGKTSFYDAVEWGITNNIYRFVRHTVANRSYAQDEKHLKYEMDKGKSPQYILRHKHSPDNREAYVKLFLANPDREKHRPVPKAIRVDSSDYNFDEKNSENLYFRKVVLSQDSIDAFLKEDHPELRYQKFMDYFGDKEIDTCYFNILHLIKANDNKIATFDKQISKYKADIPLNTDKEVLYKVNNQINELINKGEFLNNIEPTFSEKDFLNFSNTIIDKKFIVINRINKNQEQLNFIKAKEAELDIYINSKKSINEHRDSFTRLTNIKSIYVTISEINNQINTKNRSIDEKVNELLAIEEILDILPAYIRIVRDINSRKKRFEDETINLNSKIAFSRVLKNSIEDLKLKNENSISALYDINNKISELSEIEEFLKDNQGEIEKVSEKIKINAQLVFNIDNQINDLSLKLRSVEFEVNQIRNNEFPNSVKTDKNYADVINLIENNFKQIQLLNSQISEINNKVSKYKILNDEISKLALLAINVVQKSQSPVCPTCGQVYDSYNELISKINNSSVLDEELKALSLSKINFEKEIAMYLDDNKSLAQKLLSSKTELFEKIKNELSQKQAQRLEEINVGNVDKQYLAYFENIKKEYFLNLDGLSVDQYKNKLNENLLKTQKDSSEFSIDLNLKSEADVHLSHEIDTLRKALAHLDSEIKSLEISKEYIKVSKFILRNNNLNITNVDVVSNLIVLKQKEIDEENIQVTLLRDNLEKSTSKVSKFNESMVDSELRLVGELISKLDLIISNYNRFIIDQFELDSIEFNQEKLSQEMQNVVNRFANAINNDNNILFDYQKIEEYKDNVIPFLKLRDIESAIDELNIRIEFQKNTVGKLLSMEKEKLSAFINTQIESFFYEDLINKLYQKIDPHPEYKKIVFKCDFSGDVPKLNVFVNGNDQEHLIPNLYFSTAQMNILSLSIFLAKAINAKDDDGNSIDCIFIDDPIQSMDSINILSTIDLMRSISFNLNKQIILSTHDEHFHNLLKTKMPPNTFNSKFIELETFGKVKS